jgi:hypothetical protein
MKNIPSDHKRFKLNWSQLLGFNQVQSVQAKHGAKQTLAAKIGGKPAGPQPN